MPYIKDENNRRQELRNDKISKTKNLLASDGAELDLDFEHQKVKLRTGA